VKYISLVDHVLTEKLSTLSMVDIRLTQNDKNNAVCSDIDMLINYGISVTIATLPISVNYQNMLRVILD